MTLTLHKIQVHCSGVMQWWACSSLISAFSYRVRLRKLRADCSTVSFYCVTKTWPQIFKRLLQVMVARVLRMWLLNADVLAGNTERQW